MGTKVTVIVPIYNPGRYVEPCLRSLAQQSLRPEELEILLVDDGSTDDTPERLQHYAARHPNVRVVTIPNSGWPGRPRNIGIDSALGDFVMFVDQDDTLEPEALARMHTLASDHDTDVVLGKVISDFRGVNHNLYREQRPWCDVFSADLINSLTPHKMLRTAFLRREGIRYAEGPRRLEDQLFMTKAYFRARGASIVADYVCYRYLRRPDGRNAGSRRIDPIGYFANLGEVLDVVDAHTTPGEQRDGFYRRFLRVEMLGRLGGNLTRMPEDYRDTMHREIRNLLVERFPPEVDAGLGAALRARAGLVRTGTVEELVHRGAVVDDIAAAAQLLGVRQRRARTLELAVEGRLVWRGTPLRLERGVDGWLLPRALVGDNASDEQRRVGPEEAMLGDVVVRHRGKRDEWFVPAPLQGRLEVLGDHAEIVWSGKVQLDPRKAAGDADLLPGVHDFFVRLQALGLTHTTRLSAAPAAASALPPLLVDRRHQTHRLYETDRGNLSLSVRAPKERLAEVLGSAVLAGWRSGSSVLDLGVVWRNPPERVELILTSVRTGVSRAWSLVPVSAHSSRWSLAASAGHRLVLPSGSYQARLTLSVPPREVELEQDVLMTAELRRRWLRRAAGTALRRLRTRAGQVRATTRAR